MKAITPARRYRATNLEAILSAQGRHQRWLAEQAGVSRALVSHLLGGQKTVSEDVARRMATAVGVPLFLAFESLNRQEHHLDGKTEVAA